MDPARPTQLLLGYWPARALSAAAELGVLRLLADDGPATAAAVAERLGLRSPSVPDLLDALVTLGVLGFDGHEYSAAADLDADLLGLADADAYRSWAELPARLRGDPAPSMFDTLAGDPDALARFAGAMAAASAPARAGILALLPLEGERVLDVGGADARLAVALAGRHPAVQVTSFDLPAMVPLARNVVDAAGLGDRITVVGGDFLADPLPPADVVVLSLVLLDWNTETKRRLLAAAASALPAGGRLVVVDHLVEPPDPEDERPAPRPVFDLLRSLHLLVTTGDAFHYTAADLAAWLAATGFDPPDIRAIGGGFSMAVAYRAG